MSGGKALRAQLSRPRWPIAWTSARGGMRGDIADRHRFRGDDRQLLMPNDHWVVLADGDSLAPALDERSSDLADHQPQPADQPRWVQRLPRLDNITGTPARGLGRAIAVASASKLPRTVRIPTIATIAGPRRATAAIYGANGRIVVRGHAAFKTPEQADDFIAKINKAISDIKNSIALAAILSGFHAYDALTNLRLARRDHRVRFTTTLSATDARAALTRAADWSRRYFAR